MGIYLIGDRSDIIPALPVLVNLLTPECYKSVLHVEGKKGFFPVCPSCGKSEHRTENEYVQNVQRKL